MKNFYFMLIYYVFKVLFQQFNGTMLKHLEVSDFLVPIYATAKLSILCTAGLTGPWTQISTKLFSIYMYVHLMHSAQSSYWRLHGNTLLRIPNVSEIPKISTIHILSGPGENLSLNSKVRSYLRGAKCLQSSFKPYCPLTHISSLKKKSN